MINWVKTRIRLLRTSLTAWRQRGWTTRDVFEHIYSQRQWESREGSGPFDSGSGSASAPSRPYIELIRNYIKHNKVKVVADLGCGDFRVGKQICEGLAIQYCGVDIARPLVAHLNAKYQTDSIKFLCLDLVEDDLPDADLYLIRQVFQHLGNQQIQIILHKLRGKIVIVTEHLPTRSVSYNKDKAPGPDIRLYRKSGVFLEHPPFSLETQTLLEIPHPFNGIESVLRTSLIQNA